ncbi:DUF6252 family protein [Hymenobacter sp. BT635]|uniref:DUF6252 family protein n=1 Tax=Hymenobacter nitidus TaxID=2880929 RepID=A0ABS8ADP7_9BACT|nr:DUF6252 family protein [Hymenobacter nitidus]MCB2377154.1 DUF6252 family protein [Hymenobacter nitidus]
MPYPFLARAASALLLVASVACSSSKDDTPAPAKPGISWTVDNSNLTANSMQLQTSTDAYEVGAYYNLGAVASNYISLRIPKAVGTYPFSPTSVAGASYSVLNNSVATAVYYAGANPIGNGTVIGAGTIVVQEVTASQVTGTFTFTGIDRDTGNTKSLSNGKFVVRL